LNFRLVQFSKRLDFGLNGVKIKPEALGKKTAYCSELNLVKWGT
jgi:hypothetical protein